MLSLKEFVTLASKWVFTEGLSSEVL